MHCHGSRQALAIKIGWTDHTVGFLTDSGARGAVCFIASSPMDCWGVRAALGLLFWRLFCCSQSKIWEAEVVVWPGLWDTAVWRGTPVPCSSEQLEHNFLTSSFFFVLLFILLFPYNQSFGIWKLYEYSCWLCWGCLLCLAWCQEVFLNVFLGLDIILWSQLMCFSGAVLASAAGRRKVSLKIPSEGKRSWEN